MTCQECLTELATGSLRDLTPESEVARHCATCPDCGQLATQLREREYTAANVLNSLPPISNPIAVAETAAMVAQRRRVGKVVVFLTGAALAATIFISLQTTNFGRMLIGLDNSPPLETETIPLTCLTTEQAGQLVAPYLETNGSTYSVASASESAVPVITIRGTPRQIARSRAVIKEVESNPRSTCHATPADIVNDVVKRFGGTPPAAAAAVEPEVVPAPKTPTAPRK